MTLPPLRLDDLTWQDLRDLAQRRIPAASGGRWTHHAPVDPGITLLELFAFLMEQQAFVMDQVPPPLLRALLALAGAAPRPAGTARTILHLDLAPQAGFDPAARPPVIADGALFSPAAPELAGLRFTTAGPLQLLPATGLSVRADGRDVTAELVQGRAVEIFASSGRPASLELRLELAAPVRADMAGAPVAFLVRLMDGAVPPQWSAEAVAVPPPGAIAFRDLAGRTLAGVADGTGGLRRSGLVVLPVPAGWVGQDRVGLRLETESVGHAAPPVLVEASVNALAAEHRAPVSITGVAADGSALDVARQALADQILGWLPHSGLTLDLPESLGAPLVETIRLDLRDRAGLWRAWTPTESLVRHAPADTVFEAVRATRRLAFGDGYAGRVPAPASDFALAMEVGGGTEGNLGAGLDWAVRDAVDPLPHYRIRNATPAEGGAAPESLEAARDRVSTSLLERHRAVTADDFRTLVETTPGIVRHRAHVIAGLDPCLPCAHSPDAVAVYVVPAVDRADGIPRPAAPRADSGALSHIRARLETARLIGTEVFVERAPYRDATLRLSVAGRESPSLTERLRTALARYLDSSIGGPDGDGWPFGRPLRPSEMTRVAQEALGRAGVAERVAIGLDGATAVEDCVDTLIGAADLPVLTAFRVDYTAPEPGGDLL